MSRERFEKSSVRSIELADVRHFTNAGEWQLALDLLVATAIMRKRSLSQDVYAEIDLCIGAFGEPETNSKVVVTDGRQFRSNEQLGWQ